MLTAASSITIDDTSMKLEVLLPNYVDRKKIPRKYVIFFQVYRVS